MYNIGIYRAISKIKLIEFVYPSIIAITFFILKSQDLGISIFYLMFIQRRLFNHMTRKTYIQHA